MHRIGKILAVLVLANREAPAVPPPLRGAEWADAAVVKAVNEGRRSRLTELIHRA